MARQRRSFTVLAAAALSLLLVTVVLLWRHPAGQSRGDRNDPRMNIVLVSVDTLRADHMGIYGYQRSTTPFIDSFFGNGVVFERCISQAPWTLPAHMSIFTGEYSSTHGVLDKETCNVLDPSTETFVDVLHRAGYTTAAFTGGGYVAQDYGYHTFDVFDDSGKRTARNFGRMLRWIDRQAREPFFLFWHEYWPHCPYVPPPEHDIFADVNYSGPIEVRPEQGASHMARRCGIYYQKMLPKLGRADLQHIVDKYDGCIRQSDALFERLVDKLDSEGLLDRTLIVFTSDHGESFADREHERLIGHHLMYEEVLHVPLLMWGRSLPQLSSPRVPRVVQSIDIGPTILARAGLQFSHDVAGRDLFGERDRARAYAEQFGYAHRDEFSVRTEDLKVIRRSSRSDHSEEWEFYRLDRDPRELERLGEDERSAEILELAQTLGSLLPDRIRCGAAADVDEAQLKELEALGYILDTRPEPAD